MKDLRPPYVAIGMLSACVLSYEVLLTRLFSIVLWHHFAYMIISAAMLGYGASGTALTLLKDKITTLNFSRAYIIAALGVVILMPLSFLIAQQVPFNPLELLWDKTQLVKLLIIYLLMILPFFCGGFSIGLIFFRFGNSAGRVYAIDILGAGVGCIGIIGILFIVPPEKALVVVTAVSLLAVTIAITELKIQLRWLLSLLLLALTVSATFRDSWLQINSSPYKDLNQTLNITGTKVIEERSGPMGQITVVDSSLIPFRHAPGMSLNATNELPAQIGIFVDGNGPSMLTQFDGNFSKLAYLDQLTSSLPYHILEKPRALVLGAGAGGDILQALYHDATMIDAVELNHNIIDLIRERFGIFSGGLYSMQKVRIHNTEARGFINMSSDSSFDVIQIALLDSFATSSAGLYSLSESYLYTVEAFQTYLQRLTSNGILTVTRWLTLPPRDSLKLFATAISALEQNGVSDPAARLVMIRGWKTVTLLVKNSDFTADELKKVREFSHSRSFDMAYYPGININEVNQFNLLEKPYYFEGAVALLSSQKQAFFDQYKFYIEPATDDQPYFFHSFKWNAAEELFSLRKQGGMSLLDWNYPLLVIALVQAFIASVLLILTPLAVSRFRRNLPNIKVALYFLLIGLAFMFIEIAFIQKFLIFLAHPLYAIAVVLCAFLVFAAMGSWLTDRWRKKAKSIQIVSMAIMLITVISILYLAILPGLFQALMHFSDLAKIIISLGFIAPLGLCMGVPFPSGIMQLANKAQKIIPWAWAINGCASVVGAVFASLLAMHLGFTTVILMATLFYGLAFIFFRKLV